MDKTIALITGVSRAEGLGFETALQLAARGCHVIVTARDGRKAVANAKLIASGDVSCEGMALDVMSDVSVAAAAAHLTKKFGRLDILINNASGVFDPSKLTRATPVADGEAALAVNLFGAWRTIQIFEPLLLASAHPRIVNVSSEASSFGSANGMKARGDNLLAYAVSKAALNAMTVKFAAAFAETPIIINCVCPGWVATYPGTLEMGARPVPEGAKGVVWAATLPDDGPRGGFFRDGAPLAW
jgi:NAD(P)-dependent dehydrogenase (short-subunit alcohol dehydrogenase family)